MSFSSESRQRNPPVLPLAGMVDVLFLLLIFFMTASVFRDAEAQIPVNLAESETATAGSDAATQLVVTIDKDGRVFLAGREVQLQDLGELFGRLTKENLQDSVLVRADAASNVGQAVRVMDIAQQQGIKTVSIATQRPASDLEE